MTNPDYKSMTDEKLAREAVPYLVKIHQGAEVINTITRMR